MPTIMPPTSSIVGRERELAQLATLQSQVTQGLGAVLLCSGDSGIGKTRLINELAQSVRDAKWHVMIGRAYALETAIPYAPFADACEPALAAMDGNVLLRITRGDRTLLATLAPSLASAPTDNRNASQHGGVHRGPSHDGASAAELHVRLHSGVLQLLTKLAERQPLLLVLENLQWADSASIELFHFLARQAAGHQLLFVATWNETERELPDALRTMVRSLRSLGVVHDMQLEPLSIAALHQMVTLRFGVDAATTSEFAALLHDATRGNPFFAEQTLNALVANGTLRETSGGWVGWHLESLVLPRSVRDVLHAQLERLSPVARRYAELIAVAGTAVDHDMLCVVSVDETPHSAHDHANSDLHGSAHGHARDNANDDAHHDAHHDAHAEALLTALDELRAHGIVTEQLVSGEISYNVTHPMLRQAIVDAVGLARERVMHARIATALETAYTSRGASVAERHAEQIAAHWRFADPRTNARQAVQWLLLAGRQAMERFARREAAMALQAALDRADEQPDVVDENVVPQLLDELARVYRRLGEYHLAIAMCTRARDFASHKGNHHGVAVAERRMGLAFEGLGRRADAVRHFDAAIVSALQSGDTMLLARIRLAKGDSLQALGLSKEARHETALALELAEQRGDVQLLARTHRVLLKLHTWSGPAHRAWSHARSAVELAERSGARNLAWSAHWSAAVLAGFTTNMSALQHHLTQAAKLANELNSPLLQLRTAEIDIEFRAGTGDWNRALVDGERAITLARALDQTSLLARLLFWVGSVYLQRGDVLEAQILFDEAWMVSGAEAVDLDEPFEVHGVLPAYTARVIWLTAVGEHMRALALGNAAVAMADRTGYVAWAVYRLMPAMAESAAALGDHGALEELHGRLTRNSLALSHTIGRGFTAAAASEIALLNHNVNGAIDSLQEAISILEAVPYPYDAARLRLRLARILHNQGDTTEAAREAQSARQLFDQLGARPAAEDARTLLRTLGARVPAAPSAPAFDSLTERESEILGLVASRLSNKEIGSQLSISARTVGTHLANIFDKMGVRDRTTLGDLAREQGLHR